ncbi:MAG: iron-sulfur cluster assembly scaffold protein [SAR324 cluster bacterium]|nr:iron-sulfur cluster assembly scaffold protein [SAR324 cluster bacterium]
MAGQVGWIYSDKVKDHFMNPRNILRDEKDFKYDAKGMTGNVKCGDEMIMFISVNREQNSIIDCKWQTYGCASAIASTSILSEMVKGMDLDQAYKLTPKDITNELGGLPDNKIHCSVLGDKALRMAIDSYYTQNNMGDKVETKEALVVCECMGVTDHEIEEAVLEGARSFYELQEMTKISTGCGECRQDASLMMREYINRHFGESSA